MYHEFQNLLDFPSVVITSTIKKYTEYMIKLPKWTNDCFFYFLVIEHSWQLFSLWGYLFSSKLFDMLSFHIEHRSELFSFPRIPEKTMFVASSYSYDRDILIIHISNTNLLLSFSPKEVSIANFTAVWVQLYIFYLPSH